MAGHKFRPQSGHKDFRQSRQDHPGFRFLLGGWKPRHYRCVMDVRSLSTSLQMMRECWPWFKWWRKSRTLYTWIWWDMVAYRMVVPVGTEVSALQYHSFVILQGSDSENPVVFSFVFPTAYNCELPKTYGSEASAEVNDNWKHDSTDSGSDSGPGYPTLTLSNH